MRYAIYFFGIKDRVLLCIKFLLVLGWVCKFPCFDNSLGNTPTYPWIMLVQSNTSHYWLWFFSSPLYSFQYTEVSLPVSLLSVFSPRNWAQFLFFSYFQPNSLGQSGPWVMLSLFSFPKRASWPTPPTLNCFVWVSALLERNLNCHYPFIDCFLFVCHCRGQYSIYSCSSPHVLASLLLLGCYKAPAMTSYAYITIEANTTFKWIVNIPWDTQ